MVRRTVWAAALLVVAGVPVWAQDYEDPMEMQRCIWRCLADSPGAASAEYAMCVERLCSEPSDNDPGPGPTTFADPVRSAPGWFVGATSDGRGRFAGVSDPALGNSFYVMCSPDGRRYFALFGPEGPAAPLRLTMGSSAFTLNFSLENEGYYAAVSPDLREIAALQAAPDLLIQNAGGTALLHIVLTGAAEAIRSVCP